VGRWLGQALVHAMVAAVVVEALALMWRDDEPQRRIRLRLVAVSASFLPLFDLLAPVRRQEWFEERWALLSGRHWAELTVAGVGMYSIFLALFCGLGLALFVVDLARMSSSPIAPDAPYLLCRKGSVVVSARARELLDEEELRAAIAHEEAHLRYRDPELRWVLMAVRALQLFNPVVQLLVRAIARDEERRADDAVENRLALASAILKLYRAAPGAGAAAIEERCRRLLKPKSEQRPFAFLRLGAASLSLALLLFFVV
jgi:Zn-dependent protease with chaperone function